MIMIMIMIMIMMMMMMMMMNEVHFDIPLLANFKNLQPLHDSGASNVRVAPNMFKTHFWKLSAENPAGTGGG